MAETVLTLDETFLELIKLGSRIGGMEMRSDNDFENIQQLMRRFAECAQGVSEGVVAMSSALNEARAAAESAAQVVAAKAEELQLVQVQRAQKMEAFRILGEKVQALNASLVDLKRPEGHVATDQDRAKISMRLSELELQLPTLIEEVQNLKTDAEKLKMTSLELSTKSLKQSMVELSKRLQSLQQSPQVLQ